MRKQVLSLAPSGSMPGDQRWLNLESLAQVEITSEESESPIEGALVGGVGWSATQPGGQTVRLRFDQPQTLRRIWLKFVETERAWTQEFVLRWSPDQGQSYREIVRQQWNFSPPDSVREVEDYPVELAGVTALDLLLVPDISGGEARASLMQWRLA